MGNIYVIKGDPGSDPKEVEIQIDPVNSGGTIKTFIVSGKIIDGSGVGLADKVVRAYHQSFDGLTIVQIGLDATTNAIGEYNIYYNSYDASNPADPSLPEGETSANLFVSVYPDASSIELDIKSETIFLAADKEIVNLRISSEIPTFTTRYEQVLERLPSPPPAFERITGTARVEYARSIGIPESYIEIYAQADVINKQLTNPLFWRDDNDDLVQISPDGLVPTHTYDLVEVIFGILSTGISDGNYASLISISSVNKISSLNEANEENYINITDEIRDQAVALLSIDHKVTVFNDLELIEVSSTPFAYEVEGLTADRTKLLRHIGLDYDKILYFNEFLLKTEETTSSNSFWEDLVNAPLSGYPSSPISSPESDAIRLILRIFPLTVNNLSLTNGLYDDLMAAPSQEISYLGIVPEYYLEGVTPEPDDPKSWRMYVTDFGTPTNDSPTQDEINEYATVLFKIFQRVFADIAFCKELEGSGTDLEQFCINNEMLIEEERFKFNESPTAFFESRIGKIPDIFENILVENIPDLKRQVYQYTRLIRLIEIRKYVKATKLISIGLDSATAIVKRGRRPFINSASKLLEDGDQLMGNAELGRIYSRAVRQMSSSLLLKSTASKSLNGGITAVLPSELDESVIPEGETQSYLNITPQIGPLFGGRSFCDFEHCNSSFGPAAYLIDTLDFLLSAENTKEETIETVWEQLIGDLSNSASPKLGRRPEFVYLEASCQNTDTLLPYIDLVNEVLEQAVIYHQESEITDVNPVVNVTNETGLINRQTTLSSEALRAEPEYLQKGAYDTLASKDHVHVLDKYALFRHFNFWNQLSEEYLSLKNFRRAEFVHAYESFSDLSGISLDEAKVYLGVSAALESAIDGIDNLTYIYKSIGSVPLRSVSYLMDYYLLSFDELKKLLNSSFINPDKRSIQFAEGDESCDITLAEIHDGNFGGTLSYLSTTDYNNLYRFIQLKHLLGWTVEELDLVLMHPYMGNGQVGEGFYRSAAALDKISKDAGLSIQTVVNFHNPLSEQSYDGKLSQFDQIFVASSQSEDLSFPIDLSSRDNLLSIASLLNRSAEELELIANTELASSVSTATKSDLSGIYSVSSFCAAYQLPISDYYQWIQMIDPPGITASSGSDAVNETLVFISRLNWLKAQGFTLDFIQYLFHNVSIEEDGTSVDDLSKRTLQKLREALQQAYSILGVDHSGDRKSIVEGVLRLFMTEEAVTKSLTIIEAPIDENETDDSNFIDQTWGDAGVDIVEAKATLVTLVTLEGTVSGTVSGTNARFDKTLELFEALFLERLKPEDIILQSLSEDLEASADIVNTLLISLENGSGKTIMELLGERSFSLNEYMPAVGEENLIRTNYLDHFTLLSRLKKIAIFSEKQGLDQEKVEILLSFTLPGNWFALTTLDGSADVLDPSLIPSTFFSLIELLALDRRYSTKDFSLLKLIVNEEGLDSSALRSGLADGMSLNIAYLGILDSANEYGATSEGNFIEQSDYESQLWVVKIMAIMNLSTQLNCSPDQLLTWTSQDVTSSQSASLVSAIKSTYRREVWNKVSTEIRDELRELQRDALVNYLLASNDYSSIEAIYNHYLIDVEMSPCFMTSRIKNAISTIQLWVQRIVLNLEDKISFAVDDINAWSFRKNYRVWEAGRKVFVYPENWIEPELRRNKSLFFTDLEDELLQGEVTDETVTLAYVNYLTKLDEVANLEVMGVCEDDNKKLVHVFARTRNSPHRYFYRVWDDSVIWSAWEPMELDIEGDHIIPVIFNNQLMLFWPIFSKKPQEIQNFETADATTQPEEHLEIQMAFSVFRNQKWQPKNLSKSNISTSATLDNKQIFFSAREEAGILSLDIYLYIIGNTGEIGGLSPFTDLKSFYMNSCAGDLKVKNSVEAEAPTSMVEGAGASNMHLITTRDHFAIRGKEVQVGDSIAISKQNLFTKGSLGHSIIYSSNERVTLSNTPFSFQSDSRAFIANPTEDFYDSSIIRKSEKNIGDTKFSIGEIKSGIKLPTQSQVFIGVVDYFARRDAAKEFLIDRYELFKFGLVIPDDMSLAKSETESLRFFDEFGSTAKINSQYNDLTETIRKRESLDEGYYTKAPLINKGIDLMEPYLISTSAKYKQFQEDDFFKGIVHVALASSSAFVLATEELIEEVELTGTATFNRFYFQSFYHPFTCEMLSQLNRYGLSGLLKPSPDSDHWSTLFRQQGNTGFDFGEHYEINEEAIANTLDKFPQEHFDFSLNSAYGLYNWELFFHIPMMVAGQLSQNQRFEEARNWYHYIFDPTSPEEDSQSAGRFWKFGPFFEQFSEQTRFEHLIDSLNGVNQDFLDQLGQWQKEPFDPHAIAQIRVGAYMRNVVMKYMDNLIAWADQLFRRDSIESITEATQLYVLVAQMLGPRPVLVKKEESELVELNEVVNPNSENFVGHEEIESDIFQPPADENEKLGDLDPDFSSLTSLLYFGTLPNTKLLGYWDTVEDRLFKIRNCQNIEGIERTLNLFAPPIDPALLVKAASAGLDLNQVLNSVASFSLPNYRFRVLIQKANELCGDVKNLGQNLLSALEKKDAEEIALLRSSQEVNLLKAIREVKKQAIEEGKESLNSLDSALEIAEKRVEYYGSREYMNAKEKKQLKKMDKALVLQASSQVLGGIASSFSAIPQVQIGGAGISSPFVTVEYGGTQFFNVLQGASQVLGALSSIESTKASKAGIKGGYDRRKDDWDLQLSLAEKEVEQVNKQIVAAEIRIAITERELENHDIQTVQSEEIEEVMKNKYTNKELYSWMMTQVSNIYRRSYNLAFDVAKLAERSFGHELGKENVGIINFDYWDNQRKGFLAGERLQADLRKLELAYFEQNKREFELTKQIPLSLMGPDQLLLLKERGFCDINLPEVLFDLDHPGQYMRRIKSVRLTIPAVTGPYVNVNAKLTLLTNKTRVTSNSSDYTNEDNFKKDVGGIQSVAISSGQNDSGTFELNFQDERYLPFEGAGVISSWRLELSDNYRQFDYDTISDVIMSVSYTAREGGSQLKTAAENQISAGLDVLVKHLVDDGTSMQRVFSLKTHFPNALYQLLQPSTTTDEQVTSIDIKQAHFPYFLADKSLTLVDGVTLLLKKRNSPGIIASSIAFEILSPDLTTNDTDPPASLTENTILPLPYKQFTGVSGSPIQTWDLKASGTDLSINLNSDEVEDILIIVNYKVS